MVNEKDGKNQLEEAVVIWNMAQELGATCEIEHGEIINKIRAMED